MKTATTPVKQEIILPDAKRIDTKALEAVEFVKVLTIPDQETFDVAAEFLTGLKGLEKELDATFDESIKAAHDAHKKVLAAKARHYEPIKEAENILKVKMAAFQDLAEKRRIEEEKKLRLQLQKQEEDDKNARAAVLIEEGKAEEALALLDAPAEIPMMIAQPIQTKTKGVITRSVWKFRITDEKLIPRDYLVPDTVKIGRVIHAAEGKIQIPGVEAYIEKQIVAR
jgi:hypothetical protein